MTIVTRFGTLREVAANPALVVMPSSPIGVALWSLAMELTAWLAYPIGIRFLLFEDSLVVFAVLLAVDRTRRIALSCLSYVVVSHKRFSGNGDAPPFRWRVQRSDTAII